MAVIGTVLYSPSASFALTRAYVRQLLIQAGGLPYTWDGQTFSALHTTPPVYSYNVKFFANFIAWSSNSYTFDYVIEEIYYTVGSDPTHNPALCTLSWNNPPTLPHPAMCVAIHDIAGAYIPVDLPPAPSTYWQQ